MQFCQIMKCDLSRRSFRRQDHFHLLKKLRKPLGPDVFPKDVPVMSSTKLSKCRNGQYNSTPMLNSRHMSYGKL